MNEEKCEFYRENNHYCARYNMTCDDGCDYKQLQTAKEENEKLNYIIDKQDRQLATETEINISLTQQNKELEHTIKLRDEQISTMVDKMWFTECIRLQQQNKQMREALEYVLNELTPLLPKKDMFSKPNRYTWICSKCKTALKGGE